MLPATFKLTTLTLLSLLTLTAHAADKATANTPKPALTVTTEQAKPATLSLKLSANGNVTAWQEAIVGAESNGLRLIDVKVNVGDVVKRGQVLASFATDSLNADLLQIRASVAEAEAYAAEAAANADRARTLQASGMMSGQQVNQALTAEKTAKARLAAQRAAANAAQLRLGRAQVLAPDNGVISARSATIGAVLSGGQELFRLIRQSRLEWRAEVTAAELSRIAIGNSATLLLSNGESVTGTVRMVAPTVDPQTRSGVVYVDLPPNANLKAGMFAKGQFDLGSSGGLTVSQQALVVRDGFTYIFVVDKTKHVVQRKVQIGRRNGNRVEVLSGIQAKEDLVSTGAGFLNDGDFVRTVTQ